MTEDRKVIFDEIDSLEQCGDYEGLRDIAQYALDAITNDGEPLDIRVSVTSCQSDRDDTALLNELLDLWTTPGIGWGQIQDKLDSLATRRGLLTENPNAFDPAVIDPRRLMPTNRLELDPAELRAMRSKGMMFREMAKELGCSVGAVHRHCMGYVPRRVSSSVFHDFAARIERGRHEEN